MSGLGFRLVAITAAMTMTANLLLRAGMERADGGLILSGIAVAPADSAKLP